MADVNITLENDITVVTLVTEPPVAPIITVIETGPQGPAGTGGGGGGSVTAANITDATSTGRSIITAADGPAVRSLIGAKDASYAPSWGEITSKPSTFAPAAHGHVISDVTGLATALSGKSDTNHTHTASQITDSTSIGRSVLTASTAAAARTAIGANLPIVINTVGDLPPGTPADTIVLVKS